MNITEANAVHRLVKALAGGEGGSHDAAEALKRLHDRAYQALSAGPDRETLLVAQRALQTGIELAHVRAPVPDGVLVAELVDTGETAELRDLLDRVYDELDLADRDMAPVLSDDLERDIARTVELARERAVTGPGLFDVDGGVAAGG